MKLRGWVVNVICLFQLLSIVMLFSECDNTIMFVISKAVIMLVILINHKILSKYSDIVEGE